MPNTFVQVVDEQQSSLLKLRLERHLAELERVARSQNIDRIGPVNLTTDEQRWLETLRLSDPEVFTSPSARYRSGDLVRLVIECQRPDGSPVGDTVRLDFRLGEQDQVVTALEPGLSQAGPGAHWTVWALSSNAFGSQPQPKLGLPAHTPLKFSVVAE